MKKIFKKFFSLFCAAMLAISMMAGCNGSSDDSGSVEPGIVPDYSTSTKQFSFYAYAGPSNGIHTVDGDPIVETDEDGNEITFQTVEKYKEYADCGFDILLLQADDPWTDKKVQQDHVLDLLSKAKQANLKVILCDLRLLNLSASTTPIVGDNCAYATQEDLNAYVASCMKQYAESEFGDIFYGLQLRDEPSYKMLPAMGAVYQAIKAYDEDCFVQCNLLPLNNSQAKNYQEGATEDTVDTAYQWYLEEFLTQSKADYVMFDSYPMMTTEGASYILQTHLKTLQIAANVCKEKNVELYSVAQTCSWKHNGIDKTRGCSEADMYWQTNLLMGMGVKQISYFTYQTKRTNSVSGEYFTDGDSFIKWNGEKTEMYSIMQNIHREMQKLAPVILNFDYVDLRTYVGPPPACSTGFLSGVKDAESFQKITEVKPKEKTILFISEMYDAEKNQYGYMIQNLADPACKASAGAEIIFNTNWLSVYTKGENTQKQLKKGVYDITLMPGQAVFVLPY